jgi:hypothetical protein
MYALCTGNPCGCPNLARQSRTAYIGQPQGLPVLNSDTHILKHTCIYFTFQIKKPSAAYRAANGFFISYLCLILFLLRQSIRVGRT